MSYLGSIFGGNGGGGTSGNMKNGSGGMKNGVSSGGAVTKFQSPSRGANGNHARSPHVVKPGADGQRTKSPHHHLKRSQSTPSTGSKPYTVNGTSHHVPTKNGGAPKSRPSFGSQQHVPIAEVSTGVELDNDIMMNTDGGTGQGKPHIVSGSEAEDDLRKMAELLPRTITFHKVKCTHTHTHVAPPACILRTTGNCNTCALIER
jgi:hypothetical protein